MADSLFTHASAPANGVVTQNETDTYSLGVVIKSDTAGQISSIWFHVGTAGLGAIAAKANIYDYSQINTFPGNQTPYISQAFTLRSTVGWQEIVLSTPVLLPAETRRVVSISFDTSGAYYTGVSGVFAANHVSGHLTAEAQATVGNGRYSDIADSDFTKQSPVKNFSASSYSVDVTFQATQAITHYRVTEQGTSSPLDVTIVA